RRCLEYLGPGAAGTAQAGASDALDEPRGPRAGGGLAATAWLWAGGRGRVIGAMNGSTPRRTLRISALTALVVGFGLAALLIRAFGARSAEPTTVVAVVLGFVYLWL